MVVKVSTSTACWSAVRLVSVISDDLQHAGRGAFARGVLSRR
jgi:hypothetical protein